VRVKEGIPKVKRCLRTQTHSLDGVVGEGLVAAESAVDVGHLEVDLLKLVLLVGGDGGNELLDAGNEDLALGRNKLGHWGSATAALLFSH